LKLVAGLAITALLIACGGGGDSAVPEINPLRKYEGTYYSCDGNEKYFVSMTVVGPERLNLTSATEYYSSANCTGNLIGFYKLDGPAVLSFTNSTSAKLPPSSVFPYSSIVDRFSLNFQPGTTSFTGSGVTTGDPGFNCVTYKTAPNKTVTKCNALQIANPISADWALYLSSDNGYLVSFGLENGELKWNGIGSRNPEFNLASLGELTQ